MIGSGAQRTVRFGQTVDGVPVFGAQYLVHLEAEQGGYAVESANGHIFSELDEVADPSISERYARALLARRWSGLRVTRIESHGLVVLAQAGGSPAWHFTLRRSAPQLRREVFISATSGRTLLDYDNLHRDGPVVASGENSLGERTDVQAYQRGQTFEMRDQTRLMFGAGGEITTHAQINRRVNAVDDNIVTTTTGFFRDKAAVDAHVNTGKVYEYFLRLGRNSIDGQGGDLKSIVHSAAAGDCNASWDGKQMSYADCSAKRVGSFSSEMDVVGHELTHGVTESTGNLLYIGQSGAMNEAYSDYFGNAIDVEFSGTSMTHPEAGHIGEDLCESPPPKFFPCPLRNLNDGRTIEDYIFFPIDTDLAGVHENSTIYGGALWTIREQLGGKRADAIVYKALAEFTTPLDTFLDGRDAVTSAATTLAATPEELNVILAAFAAQGITDGWDTGEGTTDGTILLPDIATLEPPIAAPDIDGNRFVVGDLADDNDLFEGSPHIVAGTIDGSEPTTVVSGPLAATEGDGLPAISGNQVVWSRLEFSKNHFFVKDQDVYTSTLGGAVVPVATTKDVEYNAAIDGDLIVWERYNPDRDLSSIWAMRLGGEPFKVSVGGLYNTTPVVSGDWVVWSTFDFEDPTMLKMQNVVTGDLATIKTKKNWFFSGAPDVSDNFLYWMEGKGARSSIYRAALGSSERILVLDRDDPLAPKARFFITPVVSANDDYVVYVTEPGPAEGQKRYQQNARRDDRSGNGRNPATGDHEQG